MTDKQSINKLGKKMNYKTKKVSIKELMKNLNINDVMGMKGDDKDRNDGLLPIERLEELGGKEVLRNKENIKEIVVMVGKSNDPLEGTILYSPREDVDGLEEHYINIDDITDYNSLWELTESGWDSKGDIVYPYIYVGGNLLRWDNQNLRRIMKIYTWTKENEQKYLGLMMKEKDKSPFVGSPIRTQPKVGRNTPCPCGSGKKFKTCCLN